MCFRDYGIIHYQHRARFERIKLFLYGLGFLVLFSASIYLTGEVLRVHAERQLETVAVSGNE
jgi:hypothetical protein